jgi:hypothetical protein
MALVCMILKFGICTVISTNVDLNPSPGEALYFRRFMLSPTGRIACSSDDGCCAGRGVPADRVSQDGQILAAELETKIVTQGEVRRVL